MTAYRTRMSDFVPSDRSAEAPVGRVLEVESAPAWLRVLRLDPIGYRDAYELQKRLQAEVIERRGTPDARGHLLLLEHDPAVVTVTRRPDAASHVLASEEVLARHGIERHETDRGGDVTYHGPGQLVAYPIVDLERLGIRIHEWIRLLEQVVIDTLSTHGIVADRDPGATGVWTGRSPDDVDGVGGRKIAAIGVRVSRWVTMHGLALNVDPDLSHFDLIVPCGLAGRPVTSVAAEIDRPAPTVDDIAIELADRFGRAVAGLERRQA